MEKINIAELLKDCPKGMELDCTILDKVILAGVDNSNDPVFPIRVRRKDGCLILLTKYGQYFDDDYAKCVIFPKGKTSWEGFVPPCKFKVGDKIFNVLRKSMGALGTFQGTISEITDDKYIFTDGSYMFIDSQDNYELVPNKSDKFDITTLIPFESRVLVRDDGYSLWNPSLWGLYDKEHRFPYVTVGSRYKQCIPYENNEHLLGTTNDCDEYFKTWE